MVAKKERRSRILLDPKSIQEFKDIYYAETSIRLTSEEASAKGEKLIGLVKFLAKEQKERINDERKLERD